MNRTVTARVAGSVILLGVVFSPFLGAMAPRDDPSARPELSAEQVVATMISRNAEREKSLQCYASLRHYRLEYKGFPSSKTAEIDVAVKFTAPDKKEFQITSEQGSGLLINKVLKRLLDAEQEAASQAARYQTQLSPLNYNFELAGLAKTEDGRTQYVLNVEPLRKDKLLYRGKIWVDAEDFAVTLIEAEPARNPSFWTRQTRIVHHYTKVGQFWLPAHNESDSDTRFGGHARLSIAYGEYVLNRD